MPEPSSAEKSPFAYLGLVMSLGIVAINCTCCFFLGDIYFCHVALCLFLGLECSTLYGTTQAFRRQEQNDQLLPSLQIILSFTVLHEFLCCIMQIGRGAHMYRHMYCSQTSMMSSQSAQLFIRMQKAHDIQALRSRSLVTDIVRVPMLALHNTPCRGNC